MSVIERLRFKFSLAKDFPWVYDHLTQESMKAVSYSVVSNTVRARGSNNLGNWDRRMPRAEFIALFTSKDWPVVAYANWAEGREDRIKKSTVGRHSGA